MDVVSSVAVAIFGIVPLVLLALIAVGMACAMMWMRTVVPTNIVHIVQDRRRTISYGKDQEGSNVYYRWPSWVPYFGITVIELPMANFDLSLKSYEAYDKDRVPFMADVTAFFRIDNTNVAAQRVSTVRELHDQLTLIVQGAVRKVLASAVIDHIMLERARFGDAFTAEVQEQLAEWGVRSVKSMELMDIRDVNGSHVIANIMAKKTSAIAKESRIEVAQNTQAAETAEIEAQQTVDVRKREAEQVVGEREAAKEKAVGIAKEQARQEVLTQQKETRMRDMAVLEVEKVRTADITKKQGIVAAEQERETAIIRADGHLAAQQREATAVQTVGEAKAAAEKAMQLAPVAAQIALAQEIGANAAYQQYLVTVRAVEAYQAIGIEQAQALQQADVKVIANAGRTADGMKSAMDLFTSAGGTELGAMVEGFAQTPIGQAVLAKVGVAPEAQKKSGANGAGAS